MPDADSGRWRLLGYFLPREVRERVFDPAFSDLMYAWLTSPPPHRSVDLGIRAVCTYLGCIPIAIPHLFLRRGRPTRLGRVVSGVVLLLTVLILILVSVIRPYDAYAPVEEPGAGSAAEVSGAGR